MTSILTITWFEGLLAGLTPKSSMTPSSTFTAVLVRYRSPDWATAGPESPTMNSVNAIARAATAKRKGRKERVEQESGDERGLRTNIKRDSCVDSVSEVY